MSASQIARVALVAMTAASCGQRSSLRAERDVAPASVPASPDTAQSAKNHVMEADPPSSPLQPVATLAGEWRVAGINDRPVEGPVGLALSADDREIWWEPRCAGLVRSYRITGTHLATGPQVGLLPRKPGEPTPPVCTIAPPPQVREVVSALDAARTVGRTPNNGVRIAGGDHSVLLFSQ